MIMTYKYTFKATINEINAYYPVDEEDESTDESSDQQNSETTTSSTTTTNPPVVKNEEKTTSKSTNPLEKLDRDHLIAFIEFVKIDLKPRVSHDKERIVSDIMEILLETTPIEKVMKVLPDMIEDFADSLKGESEKTTTSTTQPEKEVGQKVEQAKVEGNSLLEQMKNKYGTKAAS